MFGGARAQALDKLFDLFTEVIALRVIITLFIVVLLIIIIALLIIAISPMCTTAATFRLVLRSSLFAPTIMAASESALSGLFPLLCAEALILIDGIRCSAPLSPSAILPCLARVDRLRKVRDKLSAQLALRVVLEA